MSLPVLISRAETDSAPIVNALAERGIDCVVWPALRFEPRPVPEDLVARLNQADALAVVSPRAMRALAAAVGDTQITTPMFAQGDATASAAPKLGALPARGAYAEDLAQTIAEHCRQGLVIRICGNRARNQLVDALTSAGFRSESIVLYDNVAPQGMERPPQPFRAAIFHSPSAVERQLAANPWLRSVPAVAIGHTTAAALHSSDHPRVIVAASPAIAAIAETLEQLP